GRHPPLEEADAVLVDQLRLIPFGALRAGISGSGVEGLSPSRPFGTRRVAGRWATGELTGLPPAFPAGSESAVHGCCTPRSGGHRRPLCRRPRPAPGR